MNFVSALGYSFPNKFFIITPISFEKQFVHVPISVADPEI